MKKKAEEDAPIRKNPTMNLAQQYALSKNETMGVQAKVLDDASKSKVLKAYQMPLDLKSKDRVSQRRFRRKAFKALMMGEVPTKIVDHKAPAFT